MKKFIGRNSFLENWVLGWGLFFGFLGLLLYFLGLAGLWYSSLLATLGIISFLVLFYFLFKLNWKHFAKGFLRDVLKDKLVLVLIVIVLIFALFNFLVALAPEIGFDALWYHLTLPKIYLATHHIHYLKGSLLYYSVMPRLAEMLYGLGLALDMGGIVSKLIHFWAGVLWFIGSFVFLRLFISRRMALISSSAIYGTFAISWLSQTAYVDLMTAFFAVVMFWGIFKYFDNREATFLYLSAVFMGFTLATKTYALLLFALVIMVLLFKAGLNKTLKYSALALLIVFPFYIQAYVATGNPVYPLFSIQDSALDQYLGGYHTLKEWYVHVWPIKLPALFWQTIIRQFTPFLGFLLLLPLAKQPRKIFWPVIFFLSFFILWSMIPVQEPRYFILILPLAALMAGYAIEKTNFPILKFIALTLIFLSFFYNFSKNLQKFKDPLNVTLGKNTRSNYLTEQLSWSQVYLDEDGSIKKKIGDGKLLTVNIHNLFYLDVPFWDWTFIEDEFKGENPSEISAKLRQKGFNFVIIGGQSASWWLGRSEQEVNQYFSLVFSNEYFNLYQIK